MKPPDLMNAWLRRASRAVHYERRTVPPWLAWLSIALLAALVGHIVYTARS